MASITKGKYERKKVADKVEKVVDKKEQEQILKEKLKMASYCPKISGCSWGYSKRKDDAKNKNNNER